MEIKLLEHTKLSNIVIGARTCYDSFSKGGNYDTSTDDITQADKSLLDTLINVNKHQSIAEHCRIFMVISNYTNDDYIKLLKHKFFDITEKDDKLFVSTNLRAILNSNFNNELKIKMLPKTFHFLIEV